jgi:hypothetical protein
MPSVRAHEMIHCNRAGTLGMKRNGVARSTLIGAIPPVDRKTMAKVETLVEAEPVGPLALKGFAQPVPAFAVERVSAAT